MRGLLGFQQRPLHGWLCRLRFVLRSGFTNRPTDSQRSYRVDIEGRTAKRIVFSDSHAAAGVARSLRVFGPSGIVPALLLQREREPSGRVRLIDAETVGVDQMIGTGVAQASLRWLGSRRDAFVESLVRRGAPDFRGYLDWVERSFAAFWVNSPFLGRKKRFIDAAVFDRFLSGNP